jgi:hypothetical protein
VVRECALPDLIEMEPRGIEFVVEFFLPREKAERDISVIVFVVLCDRILGVMDGCDLVLF